MFGMTTVGISDGRTKGPFLDDVLPRKRLVAAAGRADFLVLLVPYSPATHNLINRDVIAASQHTPVLVDFWAAWCGPCKMLGPIIEKLAGEAAGRWTLVKIDTEAHQDIAARFGIRGIPTLMLFKNGELAATKVGAMSKAQLTAFIDQQLA